MDQTKAKEPGAVGFHNINQFAAIGSPTAKAVLEQMAMEAREAKELKEAVEASKKEQVANERQTKIAAVNFEIDEALAAYEQFRVLAQNALNKAWMASMELPAGVEPRTPFFFLKKAHLPSAKPTGELYSPFTTTEQFLESFFAKGVHAAGRLRG